MSGAPACSHLVRALVLSDLLTDQEHALIGGHLVVNGRVQRITHSHLRTGTTDACQRLDWSFLRMCSRSFLDCAVTFRKPVCEQKGCQPHRRGDTRRDGDAASRDSVLRHHTQQRRAARSVLTQLV